MYAPRRRNLNRQLGCFRGCRALALHLFEWLIVVCSRRAVRSSHTGTRRRNGFWGRTIMGVLLRPTAEMGPWTVELFTGHARFRCAPPVEDATTTAVGSQA